MASGDLQMAAMFKRVMAIRQNHLTQVKGMLTKKKYPAVVGEEMSILPRDRKCTRELSGISWMRGRLVQIRGGISQKLFFWEVLQVQGNRLSEISCKKPAF